MSDRLAAEFGAGRSSAIALFRSDAPGADAASPAFQADIATALADVQADARVSGVVGTGGPGTGGSSARRATPPTS
ncbi:MAG: hypothetical protein ACSLFN_10290 [Candidatus Limnocylindrales bacterium]